LLFRFFTINTGGFGQKSPPSGFFADGEKEDSNQASPFSSLSTVAEKGFRGCGAYRMKKIHSVCNKNKKRCQSIPTNRCP